MPGPTTRAELLDLIASSYAKLRDEIDAAEPRAASLICFPEQDWTLHDVLAVRAWWTESVIEWIEAGRRGETFETPAPGFSWHETPELNARSVAAERSRARRGKKAAFASLLERLDAGVEHLRALVAELAEDELFDKGHFAWAGNWPVARWTRVNTARQYQTARSALRKALRERQA